MSQIVINNPINLLAGNFTVIMRGAVSASPEDVLDLIDREDQHLTKAQVLDSWHGELGHVPAFLLEMAQDPLCRTFSGLHAQLAMTRPKDTDQTTLDMVVTVLVLKAKTSSIIQPTGHGIRKFGQ